MSRIYIMIITTIWLSSLAALAGTAGGGCSLQVSSQNCSSCNVCDGTATANPSGTSGPKTYSWSPSPNLGQGTPTAGGLCAGTYTVVMTDSTGCTANATVTISKPVGPNTIAQSNNPVCNGINTGSISLTESGGKSPYTYSWSPAPGAGQGTANATHLLAGTYTCAITDANGCHVSSVTTINQPPVVTLILSSTAPSCDTCKDGTVTATAGGGVPGYTYSWEFDTAKTCCRTGLTKGTYTCCVQDANRCQTCNTVKVSFAVGIASLNPEEEFSISPNPFSNEIWIRLGPAWKETELDVYSLLGQMVIKQQIGSGTHELDTSILKPGIYFLSLRTGQETQIRKIIRE